MPENVAKYINAHTSELPKYMHDLERETYLKVLMPQMLSGNVQGMALQLFSQMLQPENILEIGTFTGYSSICLANGLTPNGHLYTIDINEELENMAKQYFKKAGLADKISFLAGSALQIIPQLKKQFDLVFIDADKRNYPKYYEMVLPLLTDRGIILVDNVLWDGKVADSAQFNDKDARAIRAFNEMVHNDNKVWNTILPIRDGMMMIRKV
jgi:predicted O-methyltransferase YrrM